MSNLVQRTIFGAIYVAVVVASILCHPLAFDAMFAVVAILAVRELHVLLGDSRFVRVGGMILAVLLFIFLASLGLVKQTSLYTFPEEDIWLRHIVSVTQALTLFCYPLVSLVWLIGELSFGKQAQPAKHWGDLLIGQMMVALPFALMSLLLTIDKWLLLAMFVIIWTNDTGAYCVGSLTAKRRNGNHKMAPYVSPKKSWEGLFGGAAFAIGAALLLAHFGWFDKISFHNSVSYSYIIAAGFGVIAVIGGTLGDLMESLLKRSVGVKDSGRFLPGHGGVLDRFDSALLATPLLLIFCLFLLSI